MMNRFIYLFLLLGCVASALVGCTDDPDVDPLSAGSVGKGTSWVTIDFSDNSFDEINITTRATLDNVAESRVSNLFVFIFGPKDETGNAQRLYGRYFDYTNRKESLSQLNNSKEECWWVTGNSSTDLPHGKVRIIAPEITDGGGTLYLLANVHADMVNISPDKLRFVQTLNDLKAMTASLNQQITERNGFFPMTGSAQGVSISEDGQITARGDANGNDTFPILLTRLDAKITVRVRVAKGYKGFNTSTSTEGETGSDEPGGGTTEGGGTGTTEGGGTGTTEGGGTGTTIKVKTTHTIDSFVPLSWQVVNLPRTAFVLPNTVDATNEDGERELFNTREIKFETREPETFTYKQEKIDENGEYVIENDEYVFEDPCPETTADVHGFSFYMLENRVAAKKNIPLNKPDPENPDDKNRLNEAWGSYHARDTRLNDANGAYVPDPTGKGDIWKYAPAEGTYLVIKGEIVMALDISNEGKDQQLSADVVYYIHLGDFVKSINNYNIERNTSYTYTITIYGVDNIQIEVEQDKENESGATGHVYVAKEQIFTFDSHYGRAVISFDECHLTNAEFLTWYVRTPFGREGRPHIVNGVEVPAGLDYRWVQFKINPINSDGTYKEGIEKYHPNDVMDILEFSKYIKEQKAKFDAWKNGETAVNESAFRLDFDEEWLAWYNETHGTTISEEAARADLTGDWYRYRIYLTIFVNEFYYDADPITGDVRQDLWKDFVNQPPRLMHILCDAEKSKDEASLTTGSVVTIRQRSIQTVFNTEKPDLKTAWGCETIDETRDVLWYYSRKEKYDDKGEWVKPSGVSNIPSYDGNSSEGNGLYNTAKIWGLLSSDGTYIRNSWDNYVNYDEFYALRDDDETETLRYSCMTRNRDENGDGYIDAKEVKWYMASISQLASLYVGDQGLSSEAVLYPYYKQSDRSTQMYKKQSDGSEEMDKTTNVYTWRLHIVSSTCPKEYSGYPEIMWAEEGLSTGPYNYTYGKSAHLSVRCLRNLGMDPATEEEARKKLNEENNISEIAVQAKGPGIGNNNPIFLNSVYEFDMTNLNPLSIRYYTSQELEPGNEYSVESRVYWAFETGPMSKETYTYPELYDLIREGKSPCPEGYRTPNVREGALISLRCKDWQVTDSENKVGRVSTYYSHGRPPYGSDQDPGVYSNSMSWVFNTTKTFIDEGNDVKIRCVKDVRQ